MDCDFRTRSCSNGRKRLKSVSSKMDQALGSDAFTKVVYRRGHATFAVRNAKRLKAHFDDTQRAQDHWRVYVAHMGDTESFALQITDANPENDAAFLSAISEQRSWVRHLDRGD